MPRTLDTYEKHPLCTWSAVSIQDIQRLHDHKASGLVTRVWLCLKTYAFYGKNTCFPSIRSLAERMGYDLKQNYKATIGKALRWLEDKGFISRKSRRSKERFTLLTTVKPSSPNAQPAPSEGSPNGDEKNQTINNQTKPHTPFKKGATTKKQKVRSIRRKKRIRKRDLQRMAEVQQWNEDVQAKHKQNIEEYSQALSSTSEVLQGLLKEHECKDIPTTTKGLERSYFVACVLHFYEWIDTIPQRPQTLQRRSQMCLMDVDLIEQLGLNIFQLWEHQARFGSL